MKKKYIDWVNKLTKALWGITFEEAVQEQGVVEIGGSFPNQIDEASIDEAENAFPGITKLILLLNEGKRVPTIYLKEANYYLTLATYQKMPYDDSRDVFYCSWGAMNELGGAAMGIYFTYHNGVYSSVRVWQGEV